MKVRIRSARRTVEPGWLWGYSVTDRFGWMVLVGHAESWQEAVDRVEQFLDRREMA
jgi:hypothetical protein